MTSAMDWLPALGLLGVCLWQAAIAWRWSRQLTRDRSRLPDALGHPFWRRIRASLKQLQLQHTQQANEFAENQRRAETIFDTLPQAVVQLSPDFRVQSGNRAAGRLLGVRRELDVGRAIGELIRSPAFKAWCHSHDPSREPLIEVSPKLPDVTLRFAMLHVENAVGYVLTAEDISTTLQIERLRRDFVANVSHELKTPLTVVSGYLETLQTLDLSSPERAEAMSHMQMQADQMSRLVSDLLTLSQLEASPALVPDEIDVAAMLTGLVSDANQLSKGSHRITLDMPAKARCLGNLEELKSAFSNLVSNAVRYTPHGGDIRIAWTENKDGAVFSVTDTGPGIAPHHLPRLAERFYRVDRSRSRGSGGTGLGLAIVKHIAARHGATLEISSEPGRGSTFRVRFPKAAD